MKDCKFCDKKGLLILPLRYAAVVGDEAGKALPALPGTLGHNVQDILLTHAKYAPRLLREGYLYVLINRSGLLYWEGYLVIEDAFLYKFPVETPPQIIVPFSCEPSSCGIDASMISIDKVEFVEKIYLLFTPCAMTMAKLNDYKKDPDGKVAKGKMQVFDPKTWMHGSTSQEHSVKPDQLYSHVPEFMLYKECDKALSSELGVGMKGQLFPAINAAYAGMPAPTVDTPPPGRLGVLEHKMRKVKAAAFVIYDHIGVTQELNDFRNAPLEGLEGYLAAIDGYGASNQQKMQIFEAIEEVRIGFENGIIQSTQKFLDQHKTGSDFMLDRDLSTAKMLRASGHTKDADMLEKRVADGLIIREENYKKAIEKSKAEGLQAWESKYKSRLDTDEMAAFRKTLDSNVERAYTKLAQRTTDHLKWFEADRLLNAFDVFDTAMQSSGYEFAIESAICSFGLSGCEIGADKIDAWVKADSIDRKNLYMRGYYHNQKELMDAAKQAYADIAMAASVVPAASAINAATMIKASKGLVDGFKKTDSAFDEWARNQKQIFSQKWIKPSMLGKGTGQQLGLELILFHKVSEITRTIFRKGLGGSGDVLLTAKLSGVLYARLGAVAEKLRYDELMLKIDTSKLEDGYKGRSADRNIELAERKTENKANSQIKKEIAPALEDLVADAQKKAKLKIKLVDLVGDASPATNNYHQTRIGVVLACIELVGLGEKLSHAKFNKKSALEIFGSVMAVGSIVLDTYYSAAKSIREIEPYKKILAIHKGADIVRGGFKLGAGVFGMGAGLCGAFLDLAKFEHETNIVLRRIYFLRTVTGFVSAGLTITAAFSYSENFLKHLASGYAKHHLRYRALFATGEFAAKFALRVRLLVWVARMNWVGLGFTVVEIGYLTFKDDDLQNWCEKSVFRKEKKSKNWLGTIVTKENYTDGKKELEELEKGSQSIGIGR